MSDDEIYCICRSKDVSRFMIGCDHCEEWYHGDCIKVTADEAKYIKKFYCKECRDKNSHLSVVYKSKYAEKLKEKEKKKERKQKDSKEERKKEKKKHKDKDRDRSGERHKSSHKEKKHKRDKDERKEKEEKKKPRKIISDSDSDVKPVVKDEEDKDKEKEREKEKEKQKELEWIKERKRQKEKQREEVEKRKKEKEEQERKERSSQDSKVRITDLTESWHKKSHDKEVVDISKYSSEDEWKPAAVPATIAPPPVSTSNKHKRKPLKEADYNKRKRPRKADYASTDDEEGGTPDLAPRQCQQMECTKCARVGSKYCSDQCGLSVASFRIYQTLPERIREWNLTGCMAEQKNRKELERIRDDLQKAKQRLEQLDKQTEELEKVISKGKSMTIIEHKSEDSSDEDEESHRGGSINCISCGKDVPARTAMRHMETCFNKFESQTSFGSMYKTKIEGYQMFCDFYNPQTGTYCKRLRVICPEHTKDNKHQDTEVCGFPIKKNVFKDSGEFCRLSRKECNDHFCWEKLMRAELDMDRVRQWLKLDELLEKERQEKESMSRRAGVLNLLLHSTYNHEIANKMQMMKTKQQRANQQPQAVKPQQKR